MRFHHQLSVWAQYVVFYQDRGEKGEKEEEEEEKACCGMTSIVLRYFSTLKP
jgi:hypothetical protein